VKHARQSPDLPGQIVVADAPRPVEGSVDEEPRIVHGDEGECRRPRGENQFAVHRDLAGDKGLPALAALGTDAVDEDVAEGVPKLKAHLP